MHMPKQQAAIGLVIVTSLIACGRSSTAPEEDAGPFESPVYTARALRDLTVSRTPERVARGEYLAEGILQCSTCHSERDWTKPGAPPVAGKKGAGAPWPGRPWLVAPNLTPDPETGIGRWAGR